MLYRDITLLRIRVGDEFDKRFALNVYVKSLLPVCAFVLEVCKHGNRLRLDDLRAGVITR